jgi:hypothetical protein
MRKLTTICMGLVLLGGVVGCGGSRSGSSGGNEHTLAEHRYREGAIAFCQRDSGATHAECEETAERKCNGEWSSQDECPQESTQIQSTSTIQKESTEMTPTTSTESTATTPATSKSETAKAHENCEPPKPCPEVEEGMRKEIKAAGGLAKWQQRERQREKEHP